MGLVALWHVGSSWTRARTHVPCISRRILNHCTTREVPGYGILDWTFFFSSSILNMSIHCFLTFIVSDEKSAVNCIVGCNSLAVQWLRLHSLTAEGLRLIPGLGNKIPQATRHGKKKKKKLCCCSLVWDELFFACCFENFLCLRLSTIRLCGSSCETLCIDAT